MICAHGALWSPMEHFKRGHSFEIGVPVIDEQHRGLFSSVEGAFTILKAGNKLHELSPQLRLIAQGARVHFKFEEDLMEKYADPTVQVHRDEHTSLMAQLRRLKRRNLSALRPLQSEQVMCFLFEWLTEHICTHDRKMADHLNLVGAIEAQASTTVTGNRS